MFLLSDLVQMDDPVLARAGEALQIIMVKNHWAAHELLSYKETDDVQDLVEVERILTEMKREIDMALHTVAEEIRREDQKISEKAAAEVRGGDE